MPPAKTTGGKSPGPPPLPKGPPPLPPPPRCTRCYCDWCTQSRVMDSKIQARLALCILLMFGAWALTDLRIDRLAAAVRRLSAALD